MSKYSFRGIVVLLLSVSLFAQQPTEPNPKLSPDLGESIVALNSGRVDQEVDVIVMRTMRTLSTNNKHSRSKDMSCVTVSRTRELPRAFHAVPLQLIDVQQPGLVRVSELILSCKPVPTECYQLAVSIYYTRTASTTW